MATSSDGGKGSDPRPFSISHETYTSNFDAIFRKKAPAPPAAPAHDVQPDTTPPRLLID